MRNGGKSRINKYTKSRCSGRRRDYNVINKKMREANTRCIKLKKLNNLVCEALRKILFEISYSLMPLVQLESCLLKPVD